MNSDPLSQSTPRIGNGIVCGDVIEGCQYVSWPSCQAIERFSVQPVAISVTVNVKAWRSTAVAAVVEDRVDLDEAGHSVIPFGPGTHRDLAFEQRSRLGAHPSSDLVFGSFIGQTTIDGGRRHRHQQRRGLIADGQLPEMAQYCHQLCEHGGEPFAGGHSQHRPADRQCGDDLGPVRHWPGTAHGDDRRRQRGFERLTGMASMPAGVGAQLVENPALPALTGRACSGSPLPASLLCVRPMSTPSPGPTEVIADQAGRRAVYARIFR